MTWGTVQGGTFDVRLALALALALLATAAAIGLLLRLRSLARTEHLTRAGLDATRETLQGLLGTLTQGVILVDSNGLIRQFNPAAEIMFGRLSEEARSLPIDRLIPDLRRPCTPTTTPGEDPVGPWARQLPALRSDGQSFPVRLLLRDLTLDGEHCLLVIAEDHSETERGEEHLALLRMRDPLTGLHNRQSFERELAQSAAGAGEAAGRRALCLIDIDHFKGVNDTYGHAAGDRLLKQLGQILRIKLASAKAIARLGGDEFAVLFVGDAVTDAAAACDDVVRTVKSFPFTWKERSFDATASIGLVISVPEPDGLAGVLGQADIACRMAKERGGDQVHVYNDRETESVRHRVERELLPTIGHALDRGRFHVLAQPIMSLRVPTQPMHFEVLVRMQDDHGNALVPDTFIPAAERYVLMPAIDRWVIAHLLAHKAAELKDWHARYPDRFLYALNLSGTTLMDNSFLPYVKRQFEAHAVPYPSICFEITETAAVSDLRRAKALAEALRDLGSSFAVDDFGAGFASYSYLKALPLRYLKIDGNFVRNIEHDPVDRALVESINHIGHVLGLETIAEWAETPGLIQRLREMGVDYAQGFGVGAPVQLDELALQWNITPAATKR